VLAKDKHFGYFKLMAIMGRPTRFHPAMCEEAHNYCLLGATNDELAEFFAVSPRTMRMRFDSNACARFELIP
jgi:hypothetical protein